MTASVGLLLMGTLVVGRITCASEVVCAAVCGEPGAALRDKYDVVVVGAGTGGLAAAMQSSRLGADVLLVESTDWIGGQLAAAGVTSMDEGYPPRELVRERGIYAEFHSRAVAYYRALGKSTDTSAVSEDHFAVEPHIAQRLLYEMIRDTRATPVARGRRATLDVLLTADVGALIRDGQLVKGLTLRTKSPDSSPVESQVASRVVIDATEYGDLLPLSGAAYRVGVWASTDKPVEAERIPPVQPITWTAAIKHYPDGLPADLRVTVAPTGYDEQLISANLSTTGTGDSRLPWSWERFLKYRGAPDSTSLLSAHNGSGLSPTRSHINFLPNDVAMNVVELEDRSRRSEVEYRARLRTLAVLYYVHEVMQIDDWSVANDVGYNTPYNRRQNDELVQRYPDLAPYRAALDHFPVMPYVRESRRIVGVETLTAKDIRRKAPFRPVHYSTAVAIGDYPVDVHGEHADRDLQVELTLDEQRDLPERWIEWGYGPFQIPLGAFIPAEVDGFLPAEKNLSQSRLASGATRLQPSTMLTGQAAGAIAGLACRLQVQPRHVPPKLVQQALLDAGSTLALVRYTDVPHGTELWKAVQLASLYEIIEFPGPEFKETRAVTPQELTAIASRLRDHGDGDPSRRGQPMSLQGPTKSTRGEVVREVARQLLASATEALVVERLPEEDLQRR